MAHRKRPFTLLEVLIAMALFAVLCSLLLGSYSRLALLRKETSLFEKQVDQRHHLFFKLQRLMRQLPPRRDTKEETEERLYFYTESAIPYETQSESLIFTFDNTLDPFSEFSSTQLARLFIDPEKRLCLVAWPTLWETGPHFYQQEVLYEGIESFSFSFYTPPPYPEEKEERGSEAPAPPRGWTSHWRQDYAQLPALISFTITPLEGPPLYYAFVLAQADHPVRFEKDKMTSGASLQ